MKKIGDMAVNDGKGLMDNEGLCDSLIVDLNDMMKAMAAGQYIKYCSLTVGMVQKLTNLKKGIRVDLQSRENEIEDLKKLNNELAEKAFGLPVDTGNDGTEENNDGSD